MDKPEALRLAEYLAENVRTYPQVSEDEAGGYESELDMELDNAASELRRLHAENEQLKADVRELVKVAHDFDEALGELGIHCECGLPDCRTTRLRAVLVKHGGTS